MRTVSVESSVQTLVGASNIMAFGCASMLPCVHKGTNTFDSSVERISLEHSELHILKKSGHIAYDGGRGKAGEWRAANRAGQCSGHHSETAHID